MACVTLSTLSSMTSVMGTVFQYLRLKEGMEQLSHTTLCPLQAARCASWSVYTSERDRRVGGARQSIVIRKGFQAFWVRGGLRAFERAFYGGRAAPTGLTLERSTTNCTPFFYRDTAHATHIPSNRSSGRILARTEQIDGGQKTSRTDCSLFAYPNTPTPDSLKALYLIAWRNIIGDFYKVEFDNYAFHHVPVIERTLSRFTIHSSRQRPLRNPRTGPRPLALAKPPKGGNQNTKLKSPRELNTP
eukprot:scaffold122099_cov35-Tisochrysis_lutea.AAC.4